MTTWREPTTGAFSCVPDPGDDSCDNGLLFSAEAYHLGIIKLGEFLSIARKYRVVDGVYCRHPRRADDWVAQDDLMGVASVNTDLARYICFYGESNHWTWGNRYLGRLPVFKPMIEVASSRDISLWDHLLLAGGFLANCFEGRTETSGKLLLWLTTKVLPETWYILIWKWWMKHTYGEEWLAEVMNIYFPEGHPFRAAARGKS